MSEPTARGLPARIYLPILLAIAALFLTLVISFVRTGFGVGGSIFGNGSPTKASLEQQTPSVEGGGPPAAVMDQIATLRTRIAAHPNDDVALTQLGDMYLTANKFADAIPLYEQALKANPRNVAAQTGLAEARESLKEAAGQ